MKYHNKKVIIDGLIFDSKKEANRYKELSLLEKAGAIQNLQMQKVLLEKKCSYIADFVYTENGQMVVEDAKGMRIKDYIIKRKLMLFMNGIRIKEI